MILAKEKLTFEQALGRLEKIVDAIEQGKVGLEESIERFSEGMDLIQHCRKILTEAEMKVQKLQADAAGQLRPVDLREGERDGDER